MPITYDYKVDNRYRKGIAPPDALAAYGARWISMGGGTIGDILGDRQGLAYNDPIHRDRLIHGLETLQLHIDMPFRPWQVTEQEKYRECDIDCGENPGDGTHEFAGLWSDGIHSALDIMWHMEIPYLSDYVYVEVWTLSTSDIPIYQGMPHPVS